MICAKLWFKKIWGLSFKADEGMEKLVPRIRPDQVEVRCSRDKNKKLYHHIEWCQENEIRLFWKKDDWLKVTSLWGRWCFPTEDSKIRSIKRKFYLRSLYHLCIDAVCVSWLRVLLLTIKLNEILIINLIQHCLCLKCQQSGIHLIHSPSISHPPVKTEPYPASCTSLFTLRLYSSSLTYTCSSDHSQDKHKSVGTCCTKW